VLAAKGCAEFIAAQFLPEVTFGFGGVLAVGAGVVFERFFLTLGVGGVHPVGIHVFASDLL
jgi:hypothetical protein